MMSTPQTECVDGRAARDAGGQIAIRFEVLVMVSLLSAPTVTGKIYSLLSIQGSGLRRQLLLERDSHPGPQTSVTSFAERRREHRAPNLSTNALLSVTPWAASARQEVVSNLRGDMDASMLKYAKTELEGHGPDRASRL